MTKEEITFEKLAWAAFIARLFGMTGPIAYMEIYKDYRFRESLAFAPSSLNPKEVCDKLIGGFLNKWRSRFPNNDKAASDILRSLESISPLLKAVREFTIDTIEFNKTIDIDGEQISVMNLIMTIYERIIHCHGFRTTAGAKILGVINPGLFVMWDDSIAIHYASNDRDIFNGVGYGSFLQKMQKAAHCCISDFEMHLGHKDIAGFSSKKLEVIPPVPLAKFLDEYNWISITQRINLPPKWHPDTQ